MYHGKYYSVPRNSFRRITPGQGAFFGGLFILTSSRP